MLETSIETETASTIKDSDSDSDKNNELAVNKITATCEVNNIVSDNKIEHFELEDVKNESKTETNNTVIKSDPPIMDFDDLLPYPGELGLYQIVLVLLTMPFHAFGVFVYFSQIFMTEVSSQHWCWIPELANLTASKRRSLAIPDDETARYGYSQCTSYAVNWSEVMNAVTENRSWITMPCQHGWEFDKTEIPYPTISSEFGWVCDKASYQASAQSIFFIGSVFGLVGFGWMADKYGRIPAIVASNLIGCLGGVASIFARNFLEFAICRFFVGLSYDNCMVIAYLLVLEYIVPKYRTMISNISFAVFDTVAVMALPWISLACGDWKLISLVTSLPLALAALSPLVLQESPRWLLSQGRTDDVIKNLKIVARVNKKEIPPKIIQEFKDNAKVEDDENGDILAILKRPLLRNVFILICIEHMCCDIVFDASIRTLGALDFDFFVSFTIMSFTEFPGSMVAAFTMDWMGRRWLVTSMMLVSCVFNILTGFANIGAWSVTCDVIARFSVSVCYVAVQQWAAELLPTSVRATGVSIIHMMGHVGTIIAPYIVYLGTYVVWLPFVLAGLIAGIGAVIAFVLPETAKKELPQTFDDAEELARNQKMFDSSNWWPRSKNKDPRGVVNLSFQS